jgi:hypothetical protein
VTDRYEQLLKVMIAHYTRLLNARGDTHAALVRSAYGNRQGEYLFFINQLTEAENALNKALLPQLRKTTENVGGTIKKIEHGSDRLRRSEIKEIFILLK